MSVEKRAMALAMRCYERKGYKVVNVSHSREAGHAGFDLLCTRSSDQLRVEVKGCSREWQIPDLYISEFGGEPLALIADELCVIYLVSGSKPRVCRIPRYVIEPRDLTPKQCYRISSRIKKEEVLKPFTRLIPDDLLGDV